MKRCTTSPGYILFKKLPSWNCAAQSSFCVLKNQSYLCSVDLKPVRGESRISSAKPTFIRSDKDFHIFKEVLIKHTANFSTEEANEAVSFGWYKKVWRLERFVRGKLCTLQIRITSLEAKCEFRHSSKNVSLKTIQENWYTDLNLSFYNMCLSTYKDLLLFNQCFAPPTHPYYKHLSTNEILKAKQKKNKDTFPYKVGMQTVNSIPRC